MAEFAQLAVVQALAGALMHFLWQGALVALAALTLMRVARGAGTRYAIGIGALVVDAGRADGHVSEPAGFPIGRRPRQRSPELFRTTPLVQSRDLGRCAVPDRRATPSLTQTWWPRRVCSSGCRGSWSCPCASPADGSSRDGWRRVPYGRPPITSRRSRPRWPNGWRCAARFRFSSRPRWPCPCSSGGSGPPWCFPSRRSPA